MTQIPAALVDAYALLRDNVYQHLDEAEELAMRQEDWTDDDIASARRLIPDLIQVIRAQWAKHEPTWTGRCRSCCAKWPCGSAQSIHQELKSTEREFARIYAAATG